MTKIEIGKLYKINGAGKYQNVYFLVKKIDQNWCKNYTVETYIPNNTIVLVVGLKDTLTSHKNGVVDVIFLYKFQFWSKNSKYFTKI